MSTLVTGTIKSNTTNPPLFQNTSGTEIGTLCRAWVNFDGTGTVAIRASYNVSSITDNGTGDYTVNFATAMPDANYCGVAIGANTGISNFAYSGTIIPSGTYTTTSFGLSYMAGGDTTSYSGQRNDVAHVHVAIFR
jgi:hypothetical protein